MAFSATEAAFEGFRVVRRKPMTLVFWSLFYMLVTAAVFVVAGAGLANMFATLESLQGNPDAAAVEGLGSAYFGLMALILPLGLVAGAVLNTAVARSVLKPAESAFGYLRLGMDELRVLAVTLVLGILFMLVLMVPSILVGGALGMIGADPIVGVLVAIVAVLGLLALMLWLGIRFSFAIPMTLSEGRMVFFGSFKATKGRFWPLLGMGLLAFVMSIVVALLGTLVMLPLQMAFGDINRIAELSGEDVVAILQAMWPTVLVWVVTQSVLSALQLAVIYAPFSAAYRDIYGDRPEKAFD